MSWGKHYKYFLTKSRVPFTKDSRIDIAFWKVTRICLVQWDILAILNSPPSVIGHIWHLHCTVMQNIRHQVQPRHLGKLQKLTLNQCNCILSDSQPSRGKTTCIDGKKYRTYNFLILVWESLTLDCKGVSRMDKDSAMHSTICWMGEIQIRKHIRREL